MDFVSCFTFIKFLAICPRHKEYAQRTLAGTIVEESGFNLDPPVINERLSHSPDIITDISYPQNGENILPKDSWDTKTSGSEGSETNENAQCYQVNLSTNNITVT